MGAVFHRAIATRNNDRSISLMYEYSDNGTRSSGLWNADKDATPQDVLDTFASDCSGGLSHIQDALIRMDRY